MTALYVPMVEPATALSWWFVAIVIPILVLMLQRPEQRPSWRRMLAAGVLVVGFAIAMSAEDVFMLTPCGQCALLEPGSWDRWFCELINWC